MNDFLRQTPGVIAGIVWIFLTNLLQPWFAQLGIFFYADAVFLFVPALFMPLRPAIITVILCTLFADALRAYPFGLSASLILPAFIVLVAARRELRRWPRRTWIFLAIGINSLAWAALAFILSKINSPAPSPQSALTGAFAGAGASGLLIAIFGHWFWSFQISLFGITGKDVLAGSRDKED